MTPKRPLCIIKAGGTFPETARLAGDFEQWITTGLGPHIPAPNVVDARHADALPTPGHCAGILITGSHAMVTEDRPWITRLSDWLGDRVADGTPILGICFGHQLLAQAVGGRVDYHPGGLEIGTVEVGLTPAAAGDPLFAGLPPRFAAHTVHAQSVRQPPSCAVLLARNDFEAVHAFRIGERAWGVQFHPEFDTQRMTHYVDRLAPDLRAAGRDPDTLRQSIAPTPDSAALLPRFARLAYAAD
ncbi:MAG: glutamine amidotransferase [Pseudomonadota bacterium]